MKRRSSLSNPKDIRMWRKALRMASRGALVREIVEETGINRRTYFRRMAKERQILGCGQAS